MARQLVSALLLAGLALFQGVPALPGVPVLRPDQLKRNVDFDVFAARGDFAEHCEPFPGKRVVLVTVGAEYVEMFTNWLVSAQPFLLFTEQLHVIAEDWEAMELLETLRKEKNIDFSLAAPAQKSSILEQHTGTQFGDEKYGGVVWRRPGYILSFLAQGCSVLYVDIDTVWVKDVFLDLVAAGQGDLYLTDDSEVKNWNYCTCFMYIHPTFATESLIANWDSHRNSNFNQQEFNAQLFQALDGPVATRPRMRALPFESYPPGHFADQVPGPSVLHANWVKGVPAKVEWFQQRNLWNPSALVSVSATANLFGM